MLPAIWTDHEQAALERLLPFALEEDIDSGDLTSQSLVPESAQGRAALVAREEGIVAGLAAAAAVYRALDPAVQFKSEVADGQAITPGERLALISGPARSLLTGERLALNFVGRLSGIATATGRYVAAARGTRAGIYDTRKTTPGWRVLEKYAVRAGGGINHRQGLFDAVLIKDNHLAFGSAADPNTRFTPAQAVQQARRQVPSGTVVQVEVDDLVQLEQVLAVAPDIVLLDNMNPDQLRRAVELRDQLAPAVELEASGGITLERIPDIAATGVERISIGALTHSVCCLDVGLDWDL